MSSFCQKNVQSVKKVGVSFALANEAPGTPRSEAIICYAEIMTKFIH